MIKRRLRIVCNFFILYWLVSTLNLFTVTRTLALYVVVFSWGVLMLLYKPFLRFFLLKDRFLFRIFIMSFLSIGFLYIIDLSFPYLWVNDLHMRALSLGHFIISGLDFSGIYSIIVISVLGSVITDLMYIIFKKLNK